ncbi:tetratricopeptide repeat protein [Seonamhaeicola maritimus]|uniref:Tetratricopeptide repeat protein n=1 Tax=Seonamhaeicola maritimus TaxID=2591822 RepID=A0A5C7GKC1_9FLAO|nr:tetratricopeptide repeat protein [Seonamhaeicola maritimus]TXG38773.1 tetratricopeptide repeat protein [Seonamhaeicola maritimus]
MNKFIYLLLLPIFGFGQLNIDRAQDLIKKNQFEQAEQILVEYVNGNPNDIQATELLGDAYGHQKKWDEAIEQYKKLVESSPQNANYHYKYGGVLGMKSLSVSKLKALGIIGDVKASFLKAAELDPEHVDVRWALVELYMQLPGIIGGSKSKSLKYASELENLSPVDGYLAKGYIHEYDKEPELAEKYYMQALKIGGSVTCFEKLTSFYENQNEPLKAIGNLEKAYRKHNRNAMHYQIGKVCADYNIQLEKGERCLKAFIKNHSVKDGVPLEWGYFRLAQIRKNKLDKPGALKWINKALATKVDFEQAEEEKAKILAL